MNLFIEISIKSICIAAIGCGLCWAFRHQTAHLRHWLISLTAIGLILLPIAISLGPDLPLIPEKVVQELSITPSYPMTHSSGMEVRETEKAFDPSSVSSESEHYTTFSSTLPLSTQIFLILLGSWALGTIFLFIRLALGIFRINQISRQAQIIPFPLRESQDKFAALTIKISPKVISPMTWGIFKPEIILPHSALSLGKEEIHTILMHEWTHIQRKDFLQHLIYLLATCLYWFNPFVWILKHRHVLEREKACDEQMIRCGKLPTEYASQLIAVTRKLTQPFSLTDYVAVQMAKTSQIRNRIKALLDDNPSIPLPSSKVLTNYGLLFACWIPLLAAISPISPAREIPVLQQMMKEADLVQFHSPKEEEKQHVNHTLSSIATGETMNVPTTIIEKIPNLDRIPNSNPPISMPQAVTLQHEPVSASVDPSVGTYLTWSKGSYDYQLWTLGQVQGLLTYPYLKFEESDHLLILKQTRKGKSHKTVKLVLTPAPYNGKMIQTYRDGKPNSSSWYTKGEMLEFWFKQGEWIFLARGTNKWEKKFLPMISEKLQENNEYVQQHTHPEWWEVILEHQLLKEERFLKDDEDKLNTYLTEVFSVVDADKSVISKLEALPVLKEQDFPKHDTVAVDFIGRNQPTKWNSGFTGQRKRTIFGTVLTAEGKTIQADMLSFHLEYNGYKAVMFEANFYKIEQGNISGRINRNPFVFSLNDDEGWVSIPLKEQTFQLSSDVLITLEIIDSKGHPNKGGIFLSLDKSSYRSLEEITHQKDWGIREGNYSFYLSEVP